MAGRPAVKAEIVEELMEGEAICSNLLEDLTPIDNCLLENEELDHANDKLRNEAMVFFRQALEALQNNQLTDVSKNIHAGFQRLQDAALLDHKDDKPRIDARLLLERYKGKLMVNEEKFKALIERVQGKLGKA